MRRARGSMIAVRYADDFIIGFQYQEEAEQLLSALRDRLKKFGLELHPEKTRMIEFGRFPAHNRRRRGDGKPKTFCFLGFRHVCGKTRQGYFTVIRQTMRERMRTKLKAVKVELQRRRHDSIPLVGAYLRAVVGGYIRYFGVPFNSRAIGAFRYVVGYLWKKSLERRSQTGRITWERMGRLIAKWLPPARICHPYPHQRLGVNIQGKSRMR